LTANRWMVVRRQEVELANVCITSVDNGCCCYIFHVVALVLELFLKKSIVTQWLINSFVAVNM
jgi:hypothetical protein